MQAFEQERFSIPTVAKAACSSGVLVGVSLCIRLLER